MPAVAVTRKQRILYYHLVKEDCLWRGSDRKFQKFILPRHFISVQTGTKERSIKAILQASKTTDAKRKYWLLRTESKRDGN
jgi:hypothetical protein